MIRKMEHWNINLWGPFGDGQIYERISFKENALESLFGFCGLVTQLILFVFEPEI